MNSKKEILSNIDKQIKGEDKFLGKGIEYSISKDVHLYKDKIVTIIAYNQSEEKKANLIAKVATQVHYIPMYKELLDLDPSIELIVDTPIEIVGENLVEKLILENKKIKTDLVFILRNNKANSK